LFAVLIIQNTEVKGQEKISKEKIVKFNNGLGIGIEFILLKRISFNLMGGYGAYRDCETLSLTGETGLYFKF
jgi:hypothetical protein